MSNLDELKRGVKVEVFCEGRWWSAKVSWVSDFVIKFTFPNFPNVAPRSAEFDGLHSFIWVDKMDIEKLVRVAGRVDE